MSLQWDAIDARNREKEQRERELKDFLLLQQQQTRTRKQDEKRNEMQEFQKITNAPPNITNPALVAKPVVRNDQRDLDVSFDQNLDSYSNNNHVEFHDSKTRAWLETELQHTKTQLTLLNARIDKITENQYSNASSINAISQSLSSADTKTTQNISECYSKLEKLSDRFMGISGRVNERIRVLESRDIESLDRLRVLSDELNTQRYKLESITISSTDQSNDLRNKIRDMETLCIRNNDSIAMVNNHETVIQHIHHTVESLTDTVSKKIEVTSSDIKNRIDTEQRARFQFENGMKELYSDIRKLISNLDRDVHDRIETARQQAAITFDRERSERDKSISYVVDEMHCVEKSMKEVLQSTLDKVATQILQIDDVVSAERNARGRFESGVKSEVEEGFKLIQQAVVKKFEEIQIGMAEMKLQVSTAVKALKDSVTLVEKSSDQKLEAMEEVLRAEIRSRMETDRTLSELKADFQSKTLELEQKAMEAVNQVIQEQREVAARIEEEIHKNTNQVILAKTRTIDDLENQISILRKRIIDSEAEFSSKLKIAHFASDQVEKTLIAAQEVLETRTVERIQTVNKNIDDILTRIKNSDILLEEHKSVTEDKLNHRAIQIDSALMAFKEELEARVTKTDSENTQVHIEARLSSLHKEISHCMNQLHTMRDNIDMKVAKTHLMQMEDSLKSMISGVQTKQTETDTSLISINEQIQDRTTKKEIEEIDSRTKSILLNLQLKNIEVDELFDRLRGDIKSHITKVQLNEYENRLRNYISDVESKGNSIEEKIAHLNESLAHKISRAEQTELDTKYTTIFDSLKDKISDVSTSIAESKTSIIQSVQEDVQDMVAAINKAIDSIQARSDVLETNIDSFKLRLAEQDTTNRTRIQQAVSSLEKKDADCMITVVKMTEDLGTRIKEVNSKFEDIPKIISLSDLRYEEFRKSMSENLRIDSAKYEAIISQLKQDVNLKANDSDVERVKLDFNTAIQKLNAMVELENMTVERIRNKIDESLKESSEKIQSVSNNTDKTISEITATQKSIKDLLSSRIQDLENNIISLPKSFEQTWAELRRIRTEIDSVNNISIQKIEKELSFIKSDLSSKVNSKSIDAVVATSINPLSARIDRLVLDIETVSAQNRSITAKGMNEYSNIHKPPYFDTPNKQSSIILPPLPGSQTKGSNPKLEEIADTLEY